MDDPTKKACLGIVAVTILLCVWVSAGNDGVVFMTGLAIVSALAGFITGIPINVKKAPGG